MILRFTVGLIAALGWWSSGALAQTTLGPPPPDPRLLSPLPAPESSAAPESNAPPSNATETATPEPPSSGPETSAPRSDTPPAAREPGRKSRWYGWQTLITDGATLGIFFTAAATESPELAWAGVGTFYLGAPMVHFAHRNVGRGFGSLGLRVGAPLVLGAFGAATADCQHGGEFCGFGEFALGVLIGSAVAVAVDAAALAYDSEPQHETALNLTPGVALGRNGGLFVLRGSL